MAHYKDRRVDAVAVNLRQQRKEQGDSLQAAADALGYADAKHVLALESGRREIQLPAIARAAYRYGNMLVDVRDVGAVLIVPACMTSVVVHLPNLLRAANAVTESALALRTAIETCITALAEQPISSDK